jgi:hypothetical protein
VVDKEAANFCDWFRASAEPAAAADAAAARARLGALFGKK